MSVVLVVLVVALAGCGSAGNGNGGATVSPTDGGDRAGAEPTATPTEANTDSGTGDTATPTQSDDGSGGDGTDGSADMAFSGESHAASLEKAGGYTLRVIFSSVGSRGDEITSTGTRNYTQKRILATNETYMEFPSAEQTFAYYKPPDSASDSDTVYVRAYGQNNTDSIEGAPFFPYTHFSEADRAGVDLATRLANVTEPTTVSTRFGPANKYVIDSGDQLPEPPTSEYGEVDQFRYTIVIDRDTGILVTLINRKTIVQDGESHTIVGGFELVSLGAPTIERPDWAQ